MKPALRPWIINFIAIFGVFVTEMATDIYLPAMNCLMNDLHASRKIMNMTLSSNLVGLALSAPFYGALSDSYGRRRLLLVGLCIFTIGSLLCAFAHNGYQLVFFRFLQGIGSGVAYGLGVAIQKDIYEGQRFAKARATMSLVLGFAPAIAPMIGGYLVYYVTWNVIFIIIAILGFLSVILAYLFVCETHHSQHWIPFGFQDMTNQYKKIFLHKRFVTFAKLAGVYATIYWGFIAGFTFLLLQKLNISEIEYPYFQFPLIISFIVGTILNRILTNYFQGEYLLDVALKISFFFSLIYFVETVIYPDHPTLLVIFMAPICASMGLIFPNLGMLAMESYPYSKGYAASAYGSVELLVPALGVQVMGWAYAETAKSITACVLILHILALYIWNAYVRDEKNYQKIASRDDYEE